MGRKGIKTTGRMKDVDLPPVRRMRTKLHHPLAQGFHSELFLWAGKSPKAKRLGLCSGCPRSRVYSLLAREAVSRTSF